MKINIVSQNKELANVINRTKDFDTSLLTTEQCRDLKDGALLIDNDTVGVKELLQEVENINMECVDIYYIAPEDHDPHLLNLKGIKLIPPLLSNEGVLKHLYKVLLNVEENSNIFSFFGACPSVGTTALAYSTAYELSKRHADKKVLFIPLDGKEGTDYTQSNKAFGITTVKNKLLNKMLSNDEVDEVCMNISDNLKILKGPTEIIERRHFNVKHISELLNILSSKFDIVIVDAGSDITLHSVVAALNNSDNRFLVTTQGRKAKESFIQMRQQVLKWLDIDGFYLITNMFMNNEFLPSEQEVSKQYDLSALTKINRSVFGLQAEQDKDIEHLINDNEFAKGLETVLKLVESKLNIELVVKEKPGLFSRMFRRGSNEI